jgi:hypothetical protein
LQILSQECPKFDKIKIENLLGDPISFLLSGPVKSLKFSDLQDFMGTLDDVLSNTLLFLREFYHHEHNHYSIFNFKKIIDAYGEKMEYANSIEIEEIYF